MKTRIAALLLVLSVQALGQSTLGNVYKLGSSTTAGLPVSSSKVEGGLIYLSDDAGVLWNNGSSWQSLTSGGSSSGSFWFDAGAGYIAATETLQQNDGGFIFTPKLYLGDQPTTNPVGVSLTRLTTQAGGSFDWVQPNGSGTLWGRLVCEYSNGNMELRSRVGLFSFLNASGTQASTLNGTVFSSNQTSGGDAVVLNDGARAHFGSGTTDYLAGDGGVIFSPGTIVSNNPISIATVYINAIVTDNFDYSFEPGPPVPFRLTAARFTVSAAGIGGTSSFTLRARNGSLACDFTIPCNSAPGGYRVTGTGSCASFTAVDAMRYRVEVAGDCTPDITIQGNVVFEGYFR